MTCSTGIDEKGLATEAFYRECLETDAARVRALFARAAAEGVAVRRASLSAAQLCNLLQEEAALVVLLIDVQGVYADAPWMSARGYAGHYVLLVGVEGEHYLVKDPGRKEVRHR